MAYTAFGRSTEVYRLKSNHPARPTVGWVELAKPNIFMPETIVLRWYKPNSARYFSGCEYLLRWVSQALPNLLTVQRISSSCLNLLRSMKQPVTSSTQAR
jgi:hypothetical protein